MEALTMKFKYDKSKGLLFFINPLLPVKGYSFMNICAIMFTRSEDYIKRMSQATVTHEKTHTAYRNISFEREARYVAEHPEYERKTFSYGWFKWIL